MKTGNPIKRYALITLLITLFLLGVGIAGITYRYYGIVARGITGFVLMYLLFFYIKYSDVSLDTLLLSQKKGGHLIFVFVGPLISYWATMQIIEMILFLTSR